MNKDLAPTGKLKIGLNYSNFLLVIGDDANGEPKFVAGGPSSPYYGQGSVFQAPRSAQVGLRLTY